YCRSLLLSVGSAKKITGWEQPHPVSYAIDEENAHCAYHHYITIEGKLNLFDHYLFRASFNSAAYFVNHIFVNSKRPGLLSVHDHPMETRRFGIRRRRGSGLLLETEGFCDPFGMEFAKEVDKFGVLQLSRVLLPVDEPVLSEESGHFRFAEDSKVSPLHPPVGPSGASDDGLMDFFLVFLRFAGDSPIEDVGFEARSASFSSVDVNGDEVISTPVIRRLRTSGQGGIGVSGPAQLDRDSFIVL